MAIAKQEQHAMEVAIFNFRGEAGLTKLREWLFVRKAEIDKTWPDAEGDTLLKLQGEAKLIARQIKLLDFGPTIKQEAAQ